VPFSYQWPPPSARSNPRFWALLAITVALWVATLALGVYLVVFAEHSVDAPEPRHIEVPYSGQAEAIAPMREWVVQDDGRCKPFDTFARETVLTITGRERFENHDPVAVVASWLFLYEADANRADQVGKQQRCDWEHYPFLLCDHHELRQKLYQSWLGSDATLSEEQQFGKYIEPAVIRHSTALNALLQSGAARQQEDGKAKLTVLETKAKELKKRLALYDRVRAGGQEGRERVPSPGSLGIVALDKHGSTWFSLRALQDYSKDPDSWDEMMASRRSESPSLYAGQPEQSMPTQDVRRIAREFRSLQQSYRSGDGAAFAQESQAFRETLGQTSGQFSKSDSTETASLELWFNDSKPFRKAWISSLIAAALLLVYLVLRERRPVIGRIGYFSGLLCSGVALGWAVAGFYCRVAISGRPPVSNMYESVLWVACVTAVFGIGLEAVQRRGISAFMGALLSAFGLILADQSPMILSPNIQPLQAVLRSNYWLIIHVLTIVSSYAAFALAWGIGNYALGVMAFAPDRKEQLKTLSQYCYRSIQIGVALLAAGTFLGGFWAAESWGRFWGWDPKEVWALIALLCYIIPLHARYVGWVRDLGMVIASVVCFASVVMAWYGVNFILGAGLHSYGFGGGNDLWIYWVGLLNLALVALAVCRTESAQPALVRVEYAN